MKAVIFVFRVLTVIELAAGSLSRTALSALPMHRGGEVVDDPDAQRHPDKDHRQCRIVGLTAHAPGAADNLEIFNGAFNDEQKGQGDDGQVVAPGPKRGYGHDQRAECRNPAADNQNQREQPGPQGRVQQRFTEHLVVGEKQQGQGRRGVGPQCHEAGMGTGKLALVAVDHIEADGQDDGRSWSV